MSVNKAIILGRVGKEPDIRYMTNGEAVASFSIATSETWKDKQGVKQEKVEWHNISAFRKLAEIIGEYVKKGDMIYIEGKITTEKYTDKSGVEKYSTKIIADQMQMLGGKRDAGDNQPADDRQPAAETRQQSAPAARPAQSQSGAFADFSDDIPFQNPYAGKWWSVQ